MNLDIGTMSLMVSVASLLQPIVLVFFYVVANEYRGIGIYVSGVFLSAIGFLFFLIRSLFPHLLILRFLGNLFITLAQIFYTVGIAKFTHKKVNVSFLSCLGILFILSQIYFVYIDDNYFARNASVILTSITSYSLSAYFLLWNQNSLFLISSIFTGILFIAEGGFLIFRLMMIYPTRNESLFESNHLNVMTFWSIFLFDYLRNAGFMMMVSQRLYQNLKRTATIDFLTNALNRMAIYQRLEHEIARFTRHKTSFSVILIDVDHFKSINDTYGHDQGDRVLQHLTLTVTESVRSHDLLGRWGGEEFLILLPNTKLQDALIVAERLRSRIESSPVKHGSLIYYTISAGVAAFQQCTDSAEHLIHAADQALYEAKRKGRNQVVMSHPS